MRSSDWWKITLGVLTPPPTISGLAASASTEILPGREASKIRRKPSTFLVDNYRAAYTVFAMMHPYASALGQLGY
jgi:hypothetical protein